MAEYTEIKGQKIIVTSGNPSPLIVGTVFYDTSTNTLKAVKDVSGTPTVVTLSSS